MQAQTKPQLCNVPLWVLEGAYGEDKKKNSYVLPKNLDEGGRNTNFHKYCSKLRNSGMEWGEIRSACLTLNGSRTDSSLSESEIDRIVQNACKYEKGETPPELRTEDNKFVLSLGHNGQDYYYTSSSNRRINTKREPYRKISDGSDAI